MWSAKLAVFSRDTVIVDTKDVKLEKIKKTWDNQNNERVREWNEDETRTTGPDDAYSW